MRYHGGKWRIAPWVINQFPPHSRYVEPFSGAGSVLMRKRPLPAEVLNDLDDEVVNLFRVLRCPNQAALLRELVELTPWARTEFVSAYEPTEDPVERARRLLVRAFMGRGSVGACRAARTGFRNAGWREIGRQSATANWVNYPGAIEAFTSRLRGVVIEHRPAVQVVNVYDCQETLFYCDPPYVHASRSSVATNGTAYRHEMTDQDHNDLADCLRAARGLVVLSGYDCDLYRELFGDWPTVRRPTVADSGAAREECLWFNPAAWEAKRAKGLLGYCRGVGA